MMSNVHSSPAWCYMTTTSHPGSYFPSLELEHPDPQNQIPSLHHKKGTWKISWEMRVGMTDLQFIRTLPNMVHSMVQTIKTTQPGSRGELKDDQQLFPFLLRPEEEMGLQWPGRDLGWYMRGFLTRGNAFSRTEQSHLLLLLFKNT